MKFLIASIIGLSFTCLTVFGIMEVMPAMDMDHGQILKSGCLFSGMTGYCPMNIFDHISFFEQITTAVKPGFILLISVAGGLFLMNRIWISDLRFFNILAKARLKKRWRFNKLANSFNFLGILLADGKLCPRLYQ